MHAHFRRLLSGAAALSLGALPSWGGTNTVKGTGAGTGGSHNSFFGWQAGAHTTGAGNTLIGHNSDPDNVGGASNTCMGEQSGRSNLMSQTTFFGYGAGRLLTDATGSTYAGYRAGNDGTGHMYNTAIGAHAADDCDSVFSTVVLGERALKDAEHTIESVAVGGESGASSNADYNTTAGWNSKVYGSSAGSASLGSENVVMAAGNSSYLENFNLAARNVMLGSNPAFSLEDPGSDNVIAGARAGANLVYSERNIIMGQGAAEGMQEGNDNIFLGYIAPSDQFSYGKFVVGNNSSVTPLIQGDLFFGTVTFRKLVVTGGADMVESFQSAEKPQPGMVVSLDPEREGKLRIAREAYDTRVAGIVSGAGGIHSGFKLSKANTHLDGSVDLALRGRVYCRADAAYGAIRPGDLLTTSRTPGHAMKADDYQRGRGAFVGKAMSSLENGKGLVLVLVRD